jgi:hypothetical protein
MFITSYFLHVSVFVTPTQTEVFPCFFLSCKANARAKPAKTGHGPHSFKLFVLIYVFFVLFYVFFVSFYVFFVLFYVFLCCSMYFLCCSMYFLCCSMYCLFCVVLCIVCVYMCTVLLPPGGYPVAVNKYIISYIFRKTIALFNPYPANVDNRVS